MKQADPVISQKLIDSVCSRLLDNKAVRKELPGWGHIHIDRQLPFLCLYRLPADRSDTGTENLVYGEASYIIAPGGPDYQEGLAQLIRHIAVAMSEHFGAFLLVEMWSLQDVGEQESAVSESQNPGFTVFSPKLGLLTPTVEALKNSLSAISVNRQRCDVDLQFSKTIAPAKLSPLLSQELLEKMRCYSIGLGIKPIYHDLEGETLYPFELRNLHQGISTALKKSFFAFTHYQTTISPAHYQVLGRRSVTKVVWEIDRALAEIDDSFDFLLQVTPVNTNEAWEEFKESGYRKAPRFYYRLRPFDPAVVKRRLYAIPVEKIEDPTLLQLFSEKRDELDRKLTMLGDRDTPNFLYGSIQTYGTVEEGLLETARQMLMLMPAKDLQNIGADSDTDTVSAETFVRRAEAELDHYRKSYPSLQSRVELREDIVSGAMVSGGDFLVSKWAHFPKDRVEALLHHEIGTHIVTYANGFSQPFQRLHTGLSGYDEMQEGIAVLSEYLCGGLSIARLRILAGRVVAAKCLIDGESFIETFKTLHGEYGFRPKTAFTVTTRIFRGGGLTKDAVYLRGLVGILEYIANGGSLEPLFVGKLSAKHIPLIEELQWREILSKPPLFPRYLEEPDAKERLREIVENKMDILDLIKKSKR
ncbi:MAG: flavohemoglobin expression-modulating QEGLA motif protein [Thiovulaceae bacterium]|nr:flavohemoglobin expression-modulating QEGLA motif protein [Sulfurimonadaceae bacterium]